MGDRRRTFVPVAGTGIAAGALAAVSGTRAWVEGETRGSSESGVALLGSGVGEMPLASALSLVLLAAWGVLLVTRGSVRRPVAVLAAVASLLLVATVVAGAATLPEQVADAIGEQPGVAGSPAVDTALTAWFWVAGLAALASLAAAMPAVLWSPAWPEMGSRYDAPGAGSEPGRPDGERSNLELWRSLDEGHDPTA